MSEITNPHDKFFREVWSRKEIAADFLANYLPENTLKHLELDSLQLENRSYIDENLREQYSDMLYSVNLADGDTGYVYMLFEHKSYPDHPELTLCCAQHNVSSGNHDSPARGGYSRIR